MSERTKLPRKTRSFALTHNSTENMKPTPRKAGRPSVRTQAALDALLEAAASGAPLRSCCAVAGISYETFRLWAQEEPDIIERLHEQREKARHRMLKILQDAALNDWRAADRYLQLAHREDYSPRAEINTGAVHQEENQIVVTPEVLVQLQRGYQELKASLFDSENSAND